MSVLVWDQDTQRLFETGVEKGVLFVKDEEGKHQAGVAWNGLTAFNQAPTGGEATPLFANNKKYLNLMSDEECEGTLEAYTWPTEFNICQGYKPLVTGVAGVNVGQQPRREFSFSCKTLVGNDVQDTAYGYKIHVVYNMLVSPAAKDYGTVNNDKEANTFSWDFTTTPVEVGIPGFKATAIITIDSTKLTTETEKAGLKALEDKLYGTAEAEPTLPTIKEIAEMFGWTE